MDDYITKLFACISIILSMCVFEASAQTRKHVLVISSYHPAFPSFYRQNLGIREGLKAQGFDEKNMDLDYEYMDSKRFHTEENLANFSRSLTYKVSQVNYRYDVVMVADDNALAFALSNKTSLFNGIPIVFLGVNNVKKALQMNADPQITGVVEKISIDDTFDVIRNVHGDAATLQVVVDATPSGQSNLVSLYRSQSESQLFELEVFDLSKMRYESLANQLTDNAGNAVILLSGYRDITGSSKDFYQLVEFITRHSKSPIYHFWQHGIGDGLFGGKVVSHYEQGKIAAGITAGLLLGESVKAFPVIAKSPNINVFDYDQLNAFGISEQRLPSDIQWVNKPLSLRESNPKLFWLMSGLMVGSSFIILGLLWFIWLRRRVITTLEGAYEKKNEQLTQAHNELVHSEKMAALGRLVAGIAHEINTPVGVGVTTTTHLQDLFESLENAYSSGELTKSQMESFLFNFKEGGNILLQSLENAARLISSFKQMAVDQSNESCREVFLVEYIEAIVLSLKPKIRLKNAEVNVTGSREIVLNTYPGALSQVLTNLIMNTLVHGFEHKKTECRIDIDVCEESGGAYVVYRDNGQGMNEETIKRAFDPFFTTKMGQGGSGLGLNIVYNLVKSKLGGKVSCNSIEGEHVQFSFNMSNIMQSHSDAPELMS